MSLPLIWSIQTDTRCQRTIASICYQEFTLGLEVVRELLQHSQYCSNLWCNIGASVRSPTIGGLIQIANTLLKGHTGPLRKIAFSPISLGSFYFVCVYLSEYKHKTNGNHTEKNIRETIRE